MEFIEIRCPIESKNNGEPCNAYLFDMEAGKPSTVRHTCKGGRYGHADGHTHRIEHQQDDNGVITYRELPYDEKKSYAHDSGIRFPATAEESHG